MLVWVTDARYEGGYRLWLRFSDGAEGIVDLGPVLGEDPRPLFRETHTLDSFRRFRVDMDTVVWDSGLDLAPEFLHQLVRQESQHRAAP